MFCPKCKSILVLNRATGQSKCKRPSCGHSADKGKELVTKIKHKVKEIVVTDVFEGTLPNTKIICQKC